MKYILSLLLTLAFGQAPAQYTTEAKDSLNIYYDAIKRTFEEKWFADPGKTINLKWDKSFVGLRQLFPSRYKFFTSDDLDKLPLNKKIDLYEMSKIIINDSGELAIVVTLYRFSRRSKRVQSFGVSCWVEIEYEYSCSDKKIVFKSKRSGGV